MHPQAELVVLSQRKRDLLRSIRARREDFAGQIEQALQPLRWADTVYAKWREISPGLRLMGELPGHALNQKLSPKTGDGVGGLFRWAPLALNLFRSMR